MPKARVGDIEMHYQLLGEGDPVVLIMGLGADHMGWFLQIPALTEAGYRVLAFDNRGVGQTDKPAGPYSIEQFARDTAGLMDAVGMKRAHIVGVSMGGMIAQKFALLYPERVRKLALCATLAKLDPEAHGPRSREILGVGQDAKTAEAFMRDADMTRLWLGGGDPDRLFDVVLPILFSPAFIETNRGLIESMAGMAANFAPPIEAFMRQSEAALSHDALDELHKIRAETLVLVGRDDVLTPMRYSEQLAHAIPNAHLTVIDAAGHGFNIERVAEFNAALLGFLGR